MKKLLIVVITTMSIFFFSTAEAKENCIGLLNLTTQDVWFSGTSNSGGASHFVVSPNQIRILGRKRWMKCTNNCFAMVSNEDASNPTTIWDLSLNTLILYFGPHNYKLYTNANMRCEWGPE